MTVHIIIECSATAPLFMYFGGVHADVTAISV